MWAHLVTITAFTDQAAHDQFGGEMRAKVMATPGFVQGMLLDRLNDDFVGLIVWESKAAMDAGTEVVEGIARLMEITCGPDASMRIERLEVLNFDR